MNRRAFIFTILFIVLILNVYPLYQLFATGGHLYYQNAYDESTYLQYDYSRLDGNLSRPTQFMVTLAHRAGLSAGWINFFFDLFCLTAFPLIFRKVFMELKFEEKDANALAVLALLLPALFGGLNPLVSRLFYRGLEHGWLYWITAPEAWYLPILRSPEPQLSLILLGLVLLFSLRRQSFWPLYLCAPFLYSYVALPLLFVTFALDLQGRMKGMAWGKGLAPFLSFGVIALLLWANIRFALAPDKKEMFAASHLPLLSLTAVSSFLIYFLGRKGIDPRFRATAFLAASAPLFISNQQVLTGYFFHPTNYEQNSGALCAALVLLFTVGRSKIFQKTALVLCFLFLADLGKVIFDSNNGINRKIKWSPDLEEALRLDPAHVAVNDTGLSSRLSMVFARQPLTFFAYEQIFPPLAPYHFKEYVCAKASISRDGQMKGRFDKVFEQLDGAYRYSGHDFILVNVGRKNDLTAHYDPGAEPRDCAPISLKYFLADP